MSEEIIGQEKIDVQDVFTEMNIFKILTYINANKHFARTKGATIIDPVKLDDGTWQIVFRGMNKQGQIGAVEILVSPDDMKKLTEDDMFKLLSDALEKIVAFKAESEKLIMPGSGELIK